MSAARYYVTRGKFGSPCLYDNKDRRHVLIGLRNTDVDTKEADQAAMRMLDVCARALNEVERAATWGQT